MAPIRASSQRNARHQRIWRRTAPGAEAEIRTRTPLRAAVFKFEGRGSAEVRRVPFRAGRGVPPYRMVAYRPPESCP
jgi:hypothetical protein